MPELPEVETIVRTLHDALCLGSRKCKITGVMLQRADILLPAGFDLPRHLAGRSIAAIDRRGKRIRFTLDDDNQFCIYLGMSGQLTVENAAAPVRTHTHLLLDLASPDADRPRQIRFRDPRRFGGLQWFDAQEKFDAGLGPEPLAIARNDLAARLARTRRPIKTALLDQRLIAGLGNIYVDESLFAAGIHPLTPSWRLSSRQIAHLHRAIRRILRRAIEHRGSTLRDYRDANGAAGGYATCHQVYHRTAQSCRRCKSPIARIVVGGRSTHFCPKCQLRSKKKNKVQRSQHARE